MSPLKKMGLIFTAVALTLAIGLSAACGSPAPANTEPAAEATQATEAPAAEPEATEAPAEEPAQPAGDCPAATSVSIESTNGAYADREPISWSSLGAQEAYVSRSFGTTTLSICIANFETSENLKDAALSDGQAVLVLFARVRGEGNEVPITAGDYAMKDADNNDLHVTPTIRLSGGSTLQFSVHEMDVSDFEITSITDSEVCGKFEIVEKWTKASGEFKVPIAQ